jgi:hypothetical protein
MLKLTASPPVTADQGVLELDMIEMVVSTLWWCTDVLPDEVADHMGLPRGARYMDGARLIKLMMAERAEASA